MQQFKKLGVFLHDCPADPTALAYAGLFATLADSESVRCIHVNGPESEEPIPDRAQLEADVHQHLPEPIAKITKVEVQQGSGVPEILRSARDDALDLIIVGRRLPSEQLGIGWAFARLARKAPCTVLVVPTQARPHLGRVFVPIDFSAYSRLALEQAITIARASGDAQPQLVVHSNFSVGYGYKKLGLKLTEAVAQRQEVCDRQLHDFVADVDTSGLAVELVSTSSEEAATAIQEAAVARKMDLVVVGSRGASQVFLLGSTAERILLRSVLPVLIVKKKGETVPILDALFGGN